MAYSEDNTIVHDITTDAGFRAWAQKIHDALAAVGLTNTADTGQINLATVATPAANATDAGYQIWRFNDADQAAEPVFFKISYGRGGAATTPRLSIQTGRGSDGAGNLTTASIQRQCTPTTAPSGNGFIHVGYRDGALAILFVTNTATASGAPVGRAMIERTRSPNGTVLAGSVNQITGTGASSFVESLLSGVWSTLGSVACPGSNANSGHLSLGFHRVTSVASAPLRSLLFAVSGAIGSGDTGNITIHGTAKSYRRLPVSALETLNLVSHNYLGVND